MEQFRSLVLEGKLANGQPLPPIDVSMTEFAQGTWPIKKWGSEAIVFAGFGNRDHLRVALQVLSQNVCRRTVYVHTGWRRRPDDKWYYLHAGGGIGADGLTEGIAVQLAGALGGYCLPAPPQGEDRKKAISASLNLIRRGLAPDRIMIPLYLSIFGAVLPITLDFNLFLEGRTGSFKSELSALIQQHFGPGATRWTATFP